ncbi:MAG: hypothetical protein WBP79_02495 [Candidatus Acidiferrales bacterium]
MEDRIDESKTYRVEVSGWDSAEKFFVEKTSLNWADESRKEITLQSLLDPGSVVFVRLLLPLYNSNNFPIAYQAVDVKSKDGSGRTRVSLEQLRPRPAYKDSRTDDESSVFRVA